jgi:CBS domain-containing protein/anti-sigma regulatory factor (Ser/Thr protein kinase)
MQQAQRPFVNNEKGPGLTIHEVAKAQELVYELKVGEIMTTNLTTITPAATMHQVKNLLRDKRISGIPVLVGDDLVGITSIEDLILAMEKGELAAPVTSHMATRVFTVYEDESLVQALNKFLQTKVGRLPVITREGKLVGIITPDDITRGLFKALHRAYHEEEVRRYRASHLFEDIPSDRTSLHLSYNVRVRDFTNAGRASSLLKQALGRLGVDPRIMRRVAVAAYESEMNIVIHSLNGGVLSAEVTSETIAISATDQGPGIPDVQKALEPGFSTAPDWIRELGFGAGMGLANIRNSVDEFSLASTVPTGTQLHAVVLLHPASAAATALAVK